LDIVVPHNFNVEFEFGSGVPVQREPLSGSALKPTPDGLMTPFSRPRGSSQNKHGKRPRGSAGTAG